MSDASYVDLSGVSATILEQTPAAAPVAPVPPPVTAVEVVSAPAPSGPEPEPAPPAAAPALSSELLAAVEGIVSDLSGVTAAVGDLIRFVPRLASQVHALQIRGAEKRDLVMAAAHVLVDRVIDASGRPGAHALVDTVFPHAIAGVIDVVAGRVTFQQVVSTAASNPVAVVAAGNCLSQMLSACMRKQ